MKKLIFASQSKLAFNLLKILFPSDEITAFQTLADLGPTLFKRKNQILLLDDTFLPASPEMDGFIRKLADQLPTNVKILALLPPAHGWHKAPPANLPLAGILTKPVLASDLADHLEAL